MAGKYDFTHAMVALPGRSRSPPTSPPASPANGCHGGRQWPPTLGRRRCRPPRPWRRRWRARARCQAGRLPGDDIPRSPGRARPDRPGGRRGDEQRGRRAGTPERPERERGRRRQEDGGVQGSGAGSCAGRRGPDRLRPPSLGAGPPARAPGEARRWPAGTRPASRGAADRRRTPMCRRTSMPQLLSTRTGAGSLSSAPSASARRWLPTGLPAIPSGGARSGTAPFPR